MIEKWHIQNSDCACSQRRISQANAFPVERQKYDRKQFHCYRQAESDGRNRPPSTLQRGNRLRVKPGEIVFAVIAEMASNEPGRRIASSLGVARPTDAHKYGYLSEHHTYGQTEQEAGDYAEDLAATMLATTLGIPFDAEKDYNARKEQYLMGGEIVDTTSITMAVTAEPGGVWTTTIASAILI